MIRNNVQTRKTYNLMASHKLLESYCDSVNELNNNQKNNRNYFQKFLNS
jgi:hypothetical protein